jgi:nucleoid-associated protein YgaU
MNRQADPLEPRSRHGSDGGFMQYHIVKRGESLAKIAAAYYGDSTCADSLLEANRDVLSIDDDVYPGQVLRIPRIPAP